MDCEYLLRSYHGERPDRILREVCSLTGRPCLMDTPASYRLCSRRDWVLSYQGKHPAPDPAGDALTQISHLPAEPDR